MIDTAKFEPKTIYIIYIVATPQKYFWAAFSRSS